MQENGTVNFEYGTGYLVKGRKSKSTFFAFLFIFISFALVVSLSLFSANLIVGVGGGSSKVVLNEKTYYLLSLSNFTDRVEATNSANQIILKEGAGYVLKQDKNFDVIAFAYSSATDVQNVINKLVGYPNAKIIEYKCEKISLGTDSSELLQSSLEMFDKIYSLCYSISENYSGDADYFDSLSLFNAAETQLNGVLTQLQAQSGSKIINLKTRLDQLMTELKKVTDLSLRKESFPSRMKYCAVACVELRKNLANL